MSLKINSGINTGSQLAGIGITVLVSAGTGFVSGKIISIPGRNAEPYDDAGEFDL